MPGGETIREVVIKARIQVEGDEALKKMQENARKWNGELEKAKRNEQQVTNEQKKLTQETEKTRRKQVGLDEALGKVKKAVTQAAEAYSKGNRSAGKGLDILIRKEKELTAQIKRRETAIDRARAKQGPQPGLFGRANAAVTGASSKLGGIRAAGVLAAPIAIVAIGAQALNAWAAATNRARELKKEFGIESSPLEKFSGFLNSFFGDPAQNFGPGGAFGPELKDVPATNRDQVIAAREKELNLLSQMQQAVETRYGQEFVNQKLLIQNEKQRLKTIEQIAAQEEKQRQKQVGGTLAQFNQVDQQGILDLVKKFQKGGPGAIGQKGVDFLKGTSFGQELFQQNAQKFVNKNILNELTSIIGEARRAELKQEKQTAQATILKAEKVILDVKEGITVGDIIINAKGFEDAIETGMKELTALVIKKFDEALISAKAEVRNKEAQRQGNLNAIPAP